MVPGQSELKYRNKWKKGYKYKKNLRVCGKSEVSQIQFVVMFLFILILHSIETQLEVSCLPVQEAPVGQGGGAGGGLGLNQFITNLPETLDSPANYTNVSGAVVLRTKKHFLQNLNDM